MGLLYLGVILLLLGAVFLCCSTMKGVITEAELQEKLEDVQEEIYITIIKLDSLVMDEAKRAELQVELGVLKAQEADLLQLLGKTDKSK